jgi:hypothetical protein
MSFDIPYQMRQLASSLPFPYYKRQTTFLQTFGIPEISQTVYTKIAPTVSIMHKEIKDSIKISKSKLTLTLIDLGYTYKK